MYNLSVSRTRWDFIFLCKELFAKLPIFTWTHIHFIQKCGVRFKVTIVNLLHIGYDLWRQVEYLTGFAKNIWFHLLCHSCNVLHFNTIHLFFRYSLTDFNTYIYLIQVEDKKWRFYWNSLLSWQWVHVLFTFVELE